MKPSTQKQEPRPTGKESGSEASGDEMEENAKNPDYRKFPYPKIIISRPIRRVIQYWLVKGLLALTYTLSVPMAQRLGRRLGLLLFPYLNRERRICLYQLEMIYPELEPAEREQLARSCFQHMGMTLFEVLAIPRIRRQVGRWLMLEGEEELRGAYGEGRGVILVTGHTGNWELLSLVFDGLEIPARAVVATNVNTRLNEMMIRRRRSSFLQTVERGSKESPRQLLKCLRAGDVLVVALDQDTSAPGVFVDFMGIPANTPRVAAALALKQGVPIVTGFGMRREDGSHLFRFRRITPPAGLAEGKEGTIQLTQLLSNAIEEHIRENPAQWSWTHRRWKRRPAGGNE